MRLIPPHPDHAERWWKWRQEPEGRRHNPFEDVSVALLRTRLIPADLDDNSRTLQRWMAEVDGEVVGTVSLHSMNARMGTTEIGYQIGAEYRGRGHATEAVRLLVEIAFSAGYRRVMALIAAENTASRRVVEKLGFVQEGVLRQHFLIEGRAVDEVVYAVLREEWKP